MFETVDRPTRKEKAMVLWLSPVAKYLKQEFKIMYTMFLCGLLHDILCSVIVCVTVQICMCDKKSIKTVFFFQPHFSYFLRWNGKTKMEEYERFVHEVQEVRQKYDGTSHKKIRKMALESSFGVFGLHTDTSSNNLQCFRQSNFRNPTTGSGSPTTESRCRENLSTISSIVRNASTTN